jgi:hypothetical protein
MQGVIPIPIYGSIRDKYRERIMAAYDPADLSRVLRVAHEIEQEHVDAANAVGLPGQVATKYERITVDVAAAYRALADSVGDERVVAWTITSAAQRAAQRIHRAY